MKKSCLNHGQNQLENDCMKKYSVRLLTTGLIACSLFAPTVTKAVLSFWDPQGAWGSYATYTAGSLGGTWENMSWSRNITGTNGPPADQGQASPQAFTESDAVVFAVGAGATNAGVAASTTAFTVTAANNHTVAGFFNGSLNPNSCIVTLNGAGKFTIPTGLQGFNMANSTDSSTGWLIISNVVAGAGTPTPEGNGQLFFRGTNTYTGGTSLGYSGASWSGILNFNNPYAFGTGAIKLLRGYSGSAGALVVEVASAITITNAVDWSGSLSNPPYLNIVGNANGLTFSGPWNLGTKVCNVGSGGSAANQVIISGVMSGSGGGLSKYNTGLMQLTGANTYTGKSSVQNGILKVSSLNKVTGGTASSSLGAPTTTANGTIGLGATSTTGTLLYTGAGETTDRVLDLAGTTGGATIQNDGSGAIIFSTTLTATGAGAKTLTLQGSNTGDNKIAKIIDNATANPTSLTKAQAGTWVLTGANTYGGNTTISAGTLKLGVATGIPNGANKGNVTVTGTLDLGGFSGTMNGLSGAGTVDNSTGTSTYTLSVGNNAQSSAFSGVIKNTSGTVALTKASTGTLTLSGANTYSGITTVTGGGTLLLGAAAAMPSGSDVIVASASTLDVNGFAEALGALSGPGNVINENASLTINGNNATGANVQNFNGYSGFSGAISGSGTLTKTGTGAMALRGQNTFLGTLVTVSGGTLSVGAAQDRLPTDHSVSVSSGALFQLDANNQTLASLNGSGSVNLGGGVLTVNQSGSDSFGGVVQNSELPGSSVALGHGLRGYYYTNVDFTGLGAVHDDSIVNFTNTSLLPTYSGPLAKTNQISTRWLGQVLTTTAGSYTFAVRCDDGQRLWVNGTLLAEDWVTHALTTKSGTLTLSANTRYDLVMEWMNNGGDGGAELLWTPPGDVGLFIIPADNLFLPGPGSLVKDGAGSQQLTAASTYSGGTRVANGTLEAAVNGSLGSGNVFVDNGQTLTLDTIGAIATSADLLLNATPAVNLSYSGTRNIHGLSYDGGATYQPTGTYGAVGSGAAHQDSRFNGLGLLNVTASSSATALASSSGSAAYGSSITLTATVTGGAPTPTGTVTFYDGASFLGSAALNGSGIATLAVNHLSVADSPHSITAVYGGDATHASSTSSAISQTATLATITPVPVVATKIYDANTTATIASITFGGILDNDTNYVHIAGTYTATFDTKDVGVNKNVSISGLSLLGSQSGNYQLSTTSVASTGSITNKPVFITGLVATNKVYDATVAAGTNGAAGVALAGIISPEVVNLSGAGSFAFTNKNVASPRGITVSSYTISGADSGNYVLVLSNLLANITAFPTAVASVTANNKPYDGGTVATLSGTPSLSPTKFGSDDATIGGTPVATFASATVANGKAVTVTGYTLTGVDASNYSLSQPSGLTANITQVGTTTVVTSSANPGTLNTPITFTATVTTAVPNTNSPTGSVQFRSNNVVVSGSVALVAVSPSVSKATFNLSFATAGSWPIEGDYSGDTSYVFSSGTMTETVSATPCSGTNTILSIVNNGNGTTTLTMLGTPNAQYYLVSQTDVAAALPWTPVTGSTNFANSGNGQWTFTTASGSGNKNYRSVAVHACP